MNSIKLRGYILLTLALLIASSMPIAFKLGSNIPAITLTLYIVLVGTITSFLMMVIKKGTPQLKSIIRDRTQFAAILLIGVLAFALEPLALSYSTHYVSADLASTIFRTWPIMLILLAPFVIRERVTKWDLVGVTIGFFGLAATLVGGTIISMPVYTLPFVGVLLFAAFADAFTSAISKRYSYELTGSVFICNFIALLFFIPLALFTNTWQLTNTNISTISAILFLGIFSSAIFAYVFYEALRIVRTSYASTSFISCAFITMLLSAVLLGEPVQPYYLVIAASVGLGVLVQKFGTTKKVGNFLSNRTDSEEKKLAVFDVTGAFTNTGNPRIYNAMKGNGRVLAYSNTYVLSEELISHIKRSNDQPCILFTDKHNFGNASPFELDFVRDIVGCKENDLIILGVGEPDLVIRKFDGLHEKFQNRA